MRNTWQEELNKMECGCDECLKKLLREEIKYRLYYALDMDFDDEGLDRATLSIYELILQIDRNKKYDKQTVC